MGKSKTDVSDEELGRLLDTVPTALEGITAALALLRLRNARLEAENRSLRGRLASSAAGVTATEAGDGGAYQRWVKDFDGFDGGARQTRRVKALTEFIMKMEIDGGSAAVRPLQFGDVLGFLTEHEPEVLPVQSRLEGKTMVFETSAPIPSDVRAVFQRYVPDCMQTQFIVAAAAGEEEPPASAPNARVGLEAWLKSHGRSVMTMEDVAWYLSTYERACRPMGVALKDDGKLVEVYSQVRLSAAAVDLLHNLQPHGHSIDFILTDDAGVMAALATEMHKGGDLPIIELSVEMSKEHAEANASRYRELILADDVRGLRVWGMALGFESERITEDSPMGRGMPSLIGQWLMNIQTPAGKRIGGPFASESAAWGSLCVVVKPEDVSDAG